MNAYKHRDIGQKILFYRQILTIKKYKKIILTVKIIFLYPNILYIFRISSLRSTKWYRIVKLMSGLDLRMRSGFL